ncbi:hypothetical protein BKA70DRAFT_1240759 [Coprinopsis sp. MPI-PUGE-AT-0042]|nr:hypothetical protein BKA70DRAFT_1240759 [Coprinopsis sp. MPI-PUGE-AT-0042]
MTALCSSKLESLVPYASNGLTLATFQHEPAMSALGSSSSQTFHGRERNVLLNGKLVKVVLLSDLEEDINPLRHKDVDWDAWNHISPDDVGQDDGEDKLTDHVSQISLSSPCRSSPWANLPVDPLVAVEERPLRLGPHYIGIKGPSSRQAAYVVYFGRHMGVFITWEATTMQVCGFKYNSYQGYDTVEEARRHWMHALATGTWGDPTNHGNQSIPPFEGYHIVYHPSVDSTAIPLSEAMEFKDSTTSTSSSSSSSASGHSNAPSSPIDTTYSPRLQFPSYGFTFLSDSKDSVLFHRAPSGASVVSNFSSANSTEADREQVPSHPVTEAHEPSTKGKKPAHSTPASRSKTSGILQGTRHKTNTNSSSPGPSSLGTALNSHPRLHRSDLPPSRELTPKDKYYVVQIGLEPGVYKGEAEARRHMGTSRFAFAHVEATRKAANSRFRSLMDRKEVFEAV